MDEEVHAANLAVVERVARSINPGAWALRDLRAQGERTCFTSDETIEARCAESKRQARDVLREVMAAIWEWSRREGPSADNPDSWFFEDGLSGFARAHGIELPSEDDEFPREGERIGC